MITNRKVTLTSKNQITIPADYARKMNLSKGNFLNASLQGEKLVLTPTASLGSRLAKHWIKAPKQDNHTPLRGDELKQAIRKSSAKNAS